MYNEKPEECEACKFETHDLEFYEHGLGYPKDKGHWICKICACTFSGNAHRAPHCYDQREILHMMAYCTNIILKEIKKWKSK
jgi:hypothetical protein